MTASPPPPSATPDPDTSDPDPEVGWWQRVRHWDDLFPPIRLVRTLRGLASPILLGVILGALVVDHQVCGSLGGPSAGDESMVIEIFRSWVPPLDWATMGNDSSVAVGSWQGIAKMVFRILLWTGPLMILMRQGARLTAGRNLDHVKPTFRLVIRRLPAGWMMTAIPMLCSALFAVGVWLIVMFSRALPDVAWVDSFMAFLAVAVAMPASILLAGSIAAVPLGLAAVVNEAEPDLLDSLSRGYEATLRGWLPLVGNVLVAMGCLFPVVLAAEVLARVASAWVGGLCVAAGADALLDPVDSWLSRIVPTATMTASGLLTGGVYLLMRRQVGGQEVEDLWESHVALPPELPELQPASEETSE